MQNIFKIFTIITIVSAILFIYISYEDNKFKSNPLSDGIVKKLKVKNNELRLKAKAIYNVDYNFPIIISKKINSQLFGLTTYDQSGQIKIILNKKRFQENENYMIDHVLPHEYAHAMMFYFGDFSKKFGGHTKRWQNICINLGGKKCERFVGKNDILIEKIGAIY